MKFTTITHKDLKKKQKKGCLHILPVFAPGKKGQSFQLLYPKKDYKNYLQSFKDHPLSKEFLGSKGETLYFSLGKDKWTAILLSLGKESDCTHERLRRQFGSLMKNSMIKKFSTLVIDLTLLENCLGEGSLLQSLTETIKMCFYSFQQYKSLPKTTHKPGLPKEISFLMGEKLSSAQELLKRGVNVGDSINTVRDYINMPPNELHSEAFAKSIQKEVKEELQNFNVSIKVLNKKMIEKEKMRLLLAVNSGSQYEPRVVHLTYRPKAKKGTPLKIALVGKGLTFDTGGYSLKPPKSQIDMKFDMGGAATMYGVFKSLAKNGCPHEVHCFLGITDNFISDKAITPDSIVQSRSGKFVEILNTDAEGRLVLADVLDYTCDIVKPHLIIDAATLTGACLVALGSEVGGVLGNHQKLIDRLLKTSLHQGEHFWQLPIFDDHQEDMRSDIADLRNISKNGTGGTIKAACFLSNFIKNDTPWIHLDIAGLAFTQSHLSYCPKGASGLGVRTVANFIENLTKESFS